MSTKISPLAALYDEARAAQARRLKARRLMDVVGTDLLVDYLLACPPPTGRPPGFDFGALSSSIPGDVHGSERQANAPRQFG